MIELCFRAPGREISRAELAARVAPRAPLRLEWLRPGPGRDPIAAGRRVEARAPAAALSREPHLAPAAVWLALCLAPAWPRGELELAGGGGLRFEVEEERAGVARLRLSPPSEAVTAQVLDALAALGAPVLGDVRRGGVAVAGGLQLAEAGQGVRLDWPREAVRKGGAKPVPLRVSDAAARVLRRGHPWLLPDDDSEDADACAPGQLLALSERGGRGLGVARCEGAPTRIAARIWSSGDRSPSLRERVERACERRAALFAERDTDVFRVVHGEADGLPGVAADRLGSLLRVLWLGRACEPLREPLIAALCEQLEKRTGASPPVVEVVHLTPRPRGRLACVRVARGEVEAGPVRVSERGLGLWAEAGLAEPHRPRPGFGVYPDQRDNRARLALLAAGGGRWLNLFAHTGAFSAALLAAGAEMVESVDISRSYLEILEQNLELNQLSGERHRAIRLDGRRYLERLSPADRYAGIVLDPPTAAASGHRYWSVTRELPPLVERALRQLEPGGALLLCRNDRRGARGAGQPAALLQRAAKRAGVTLAHVEEAGPGCDFPHLPHFPEGDPFAGALAVRAGAH